MSDFEITHDQAEQRFETTVDGHMARLRYRLGDGSITFTSTQVPPPIEGRGIGGALAKAGLEYAVAESLTVVPACSFVRAYIDNHPEYQSLVG